MRKSIGLGVRGISGASCGESLLVHSSPTGESGWMDFRPAYLPGARSPVLLFWRGDIDHRDEGRNLQDRYSGSPMGWKWKMNSKQGMVHELGLL